jgi:hypothetical protein
MNLIQINKEKFQENSAVHISTIRNTEHLHRPTANLSHFEKSTPYAIFKIFNSFLCSHTSLMNEKAQFNL